MTDVSALQDLVSNTMETQPKPLSKLGYFCKPFQPTSGPFRDKVVKIYMGRAQSEEIDRLCQYHDEYVDLLRKLGVLFPETQIVHLKRGSQSIPVILQEAIPSECMMRTQMLDCNNYKALELMDAAGETIAQFWNNLTPEMGRVGFHPSIRNFAITETRTIFFDSFPPLHRHTHHYRSSRQIRHCAHF